LSPNKISVEKFHTFYQQITIDVFEQSGLFFKYKKLLIAVFKTDGFLLLHSFTQEIVRQNHGEK
jgi:hypothetical protein